MMQAKYEAKGGANKNDNFKMGKREGTGYDANLLDGDGLSKGGKTGLGSSGPMKMSDYMHGAGYGQRTDTGDGYSKG